MSNSNSLNRRIRRRLVRALPKNVRQALRRYQGGARPARARVVPETVRSFGQGLDAKRYAQARTWADQLFDDPSTRDLGALLRGMVAERTGHFALALREFDRVPELAWEHAPRPYLAALFRTDRERGLAQAESLLAGPSSLSAEDWLTMLANAYGPGQGALLTKIYERAVSAAPVADTAMRRRLDWVQPWLGAEQGRSTPAKSGCVSFAVIDYRQPGPDGGASSRNIGDWAQTLASLGHLVRHQNLRFHGPDDLVGLLGELQQRVRPELQSAEITADVDIRILQRDASSYQEFPPDTWALIFGWFMHPLFDIDRFDFPLHPNVRPIFVSFHCAKKGLLSSEAVAYLAEHAPIGCRDWTTVDILLSLGVPAFFSGCLTTTIDAVYEPVVRKPDSATLYVDSRRSPVPSGSTNVRQSLPGVLTNSFVENVRAVMARLETWRFSYTHVKTSRLHVYLPCRSVGLEVDYEPESLSDPRVNGLLPLSEEGFAQIRDGMRQRLEPVITAILSGRAEEAARIWREINVDEIRLAAERHARVHVLDVDQNSLRAARQLAKHAGPGEGVQVIFVPRDTEWKHLSGALEGLRPRIAADATVWVVGDSAPSAKCPDPRVRLVDTSAIPAPRGAAVERRNQLLALLPEIVAGGRAVLLPVASAVRGDLGHLVQQPLGGRLLAARDSSSSQRSGTQALFRVARSFDADSARANELLREFLRRHRFDPRWIDAEVLVLDLPGMRAADTAARLTAAMDEFGLDWPHALMFEFGESIAELDTSWASVPTRDPCTDAEAWVWIDGPKPWSSPYSSSKALWGAT